MTDVNQPTGGPAAVAGAWIDEQSLRLSLGMLRAVRFGGLSVVLPNGQPMHIAGLEPGPRATINIRRARVARSFIAHGAVGFAESYLDGDWDTPDLPVLLHFFALNEPALAPAWRGRAWYRTFRRFTHGLRSNTRRGSRHNIADHYDLGNEFYRRWLDPSMTYSSAVYASPNQSLEDAQRNKYGRIADLLALQPGQSLLEIGCGWGGFARFAAAERGSQVTAITLSREQYDFARRQVHEQGLAERVDVRLIDYRDVTGTFDRVASIEMLEAVGEQYWPVYFSKIRENLVSGGLAAVQVITIGDHWFDDYRRDADFIQRYVFPGGMLPSETALRRATEDAGLGWRELSRFGGHYANTLAEWQQRFQSAWGDVAKLGFDTRFKRLWEYYLAYCEAGFRVGYIDLVQVGLARS
ncbi:MAG: class I SAM-dependent methyltransferase [Rhodospirillaceae bacterium]|nr:class I SAM-dependent methyltransferase [Rhodospirillaceae bacterium]